MIFDDRRAAGRALVPDLEGFGNESPVVLALPRGGVPIGFEIARALSAPLDIVVVRKLGATRQPELAVGALAEQDVVIVDPDIVEMAGMTSDDLDEVLRRETDELQRRIHIYRGSRPPAELTGRTVIIADDGLATGLTMLAAVRAARGHGARRVVVAVPVGSAQAVARLQPEAEQVVCASLPTKLDGVGRWYRDFSEVTDREVRELLADAQANVARTGLDEPEAGS